MQQREKEEQYKLKVMLSGLALENRLYLSILK